MEELAVTHQEEEILTGFFCDGNLPRYEIHCPAEGIVHAERGDKGIDLESCDEKSVDHTYDCSRGKGSDGTQHDASCGINNGDEGERRKRL